MPLTPELLAAFDASVKPVTEARLLPPEVYTSQEFFEFEKRAIFMREWFCVGRHDQIPEPGDYFSTAFAGERLIVTRDKDATIRVMSAVCQHRGMIITEDAGNCQRFTCPYHHWSYALDGSLVGAPAMEQSVGFDRSQHSLPQLKVELWQGFIFANFDPNAAPLAPGLRKIDDFLTNYHLDTTTTLQGKHLPNLPWNWKVMLENFNDPYHASRLHGPLQTFAPSHLNEYLEWDDSDMAIARIQGFTHIDGSFNPTKKAILPTFKDLTEKDRMQGSFVLIPPSLALAIVPDEVAYFIIDPVGPSEISIQIQYCFEESALKDPMFEFLFAAAEAGVDNFNREDIYADKMTQIGLQSTFAPRGRYSYQEQTLQQFNRWLVQRYREHWPQPA